MNIVEKILKEHIREEGATEIAISIDQTLTQDATGTMAYLEFEAIGLESVQTELSVSYVDHNTIQDGYENADDHVYLQTVAEKYGLYFSRAGNGICHQVHLEEFAVPGKTLLGSDSHTPTAGGIGSLAIGAGGLDVATAMAGGVFYLPTPKVCRVNLNGKLKSYVSAKDIILKILQKLTTKGNVGFIIEYSGTALPYLSVPERATITNMGAELGVTTSIFPSDKVTRKFMKAQSRESDWKELLPDKDAEYDKIIDIDLDGLKPMVALPHSPDNVKEVSELSDLKVDQVLIGSCTNGSYKDIFTVSTLLEGKKIADNVSFGVSPGSKQVLETALKDDLIYNIVSSGARLLESTCGFCIGMGQSPNTEAVSVRTNNRNFFGRSGTESAGIYIVSPETAVATALNGKLTDPSAYFKHEPEFVQPEKFLKNPSLLIKPLEPKKRAAIQIIKGPNIGNPPVGDVLQDKITLKVAIKVGDKITTDHIMPAGKYLKYRSNIEKYSDFVFVNVDSEFALRCRENRDNKLYNLILAGESYGQGSSREHAAICPMHLGVKVIISKSIERIHRANLINFGIIPLSFKNNADYDDIAQGDELILSNIIETLKHNRELTLVNNSKNTEYLLQYQFSDRELHYIINGGKLNSLKEENC